jgi:TRAP-type transport system small permease protein
LRRLVKNGFHFVEVFLVLCLALMVAMVFANVVLRYGFSTGIVFSEEISRYLFVWVIFLGAVVAMRDHAHIGMDGLIRRLSKRGRQLCFTASCILMLGCCALLLYGGWRQTFLNWNASAQISGIPMAFVYGVMVVSAFGMGAVITWQLYGGLMGSVDEQLNADTNGPSPRDMAP